jgi:uncharacterized membrane protein YkvI
MPYAQKITTSSKEKQQQAVVTGFFRKDKNNRMEISGLTNGGIMITHIIFRFFCSCLKFKCPYMPRLDLPHLAIMHFMA